MEGLEGRVVLSTVYWNSASAPTGGAWNVTSNWIGGALPGPGDDVIIDLAAPGTVTFNATASIDSLTVVDSTTDFTVTSGTFSISSDSTIAGAYTQTGGTLTGPGSLEVRGPLTWTGGAMSGSGSTDARGGLTIGMAPPVGQQAHWAVNLSGRTLNNHGSLVKSGGTGSAVIAVAFENMGTLKVQSGTLALMGAFSNYSSATRTLTGGSYVVAGTLRFNNADVVTNAAAITLVGAGSKIVDGGGVDGLRNLATNAAAGSFNVLGGRTFTAAGAFANAGTVAVGEGSTFRATGAYNQSAGTTDLQGGTLASTAGAINLNGGVLQGVGTVQANVTNAASVVPGRGDEPGIVTIVGNYAQAVAGQLTANLGGTAPDSGYGRLDVSGTATLGGTLVAPLVGGFLPQDGDSFLVVRYGSRSGEFASIVTPNLPPKGTTIDAEYAARGVFLNAQVVPVLTSIVVTPATASAAKGLTTQFTATGHYNDGSTADLTNLVAWASASPATASISNADGSRGLARGLAVGSTQIIATLDDGFGDDVSGTATLDVTPAELVSIAVTPASANVAKGLTSQFTATGTYTDATMADLSGVVVWTSSAPAVATVSNAAGSKGLATGTGVGSASIAASLGGVGGSATLVATAAELVSIAVTPASAAVQAGASTSFTATGTYTDGSTADLSGSASWTSSLESVATVSAAGVAVGVAPGSTTIAAAVGGISASAALAVEAAAPAVVSATAVSWGAAGMASLQTAPDGLRLLPTGRTNTIGWLGIDRISIALDKAATLSAADVVVSGLIGASYGPVSIVGTGASYLIILARPIDAADRVTITIGSASIATFSRRLDVLPGDVNDDGLVTMQDAVVIRNGVTGFASVVQPAAWLDVLGEGVATLEGYNATRRRIGARMP